MRNRLDHRIFVLLLAGLILAGISVSCSSTQRIDLRLSGAGSARAVIRLSPVLVSYLQDLAATVSGSAPAKDRPIFDLAALRAAFARYPELSLVDAATPSIDTLSLTVQFADAANVLSGVGADAGTADFVSFRADGPVRTLSIRLDRSVVGRLLQLTPLAGSVAGNVLLPPEDAPMSEGEYTSYLAWALEDYAVGKDITRTISDSRVEVRIAIEGTLISVDGGRQEGNSALFSIPVVRLLTLTKPLVYTITFR
ncbi:MAG TPA: hypothetical protein VMW87_04945 [Spirochaetia bacterium]|nr:hypothetical protein [Spirochaetia bacterium]